MNHAKQHIATLLGLLTIIVILVTVIDVTCFDKSFYNSQFTKLDVASEIGVSSTDLKKITDVLLDYTQGKRSDMIVKVNISGSVQEVFNKREKDHMVDVRALYLNAVMFRNIAAVVVIAMSVLFAFLYRKKTIRILVRGFQQASVLFGILLAFILIYSLVDFNAFWIFFHQIFFRNDLWQLNPNTDLLILMVPEPFFNALVLRIMIRFIASFGLVLAGGSLWIRNRKSS